MIEKAYAGNVDTVLGSVSTFPEYIKLVYNWMLGAGVSIAVLMIIYSGFIIVTSGGNPEAVSGAKRDLTLSISGLVLLFAAKIVIDIIWKPF